MSDLSWKVKGQPWPLELIYSHFLIRLNITSENNDFGFHSFKKINFKKNSHLNALGSKIWPWYKVGQGPPRIIIWTNLVSPTSPMLHTKSKGHQPSGSGEEDLKSFFYHIWAWRLSWSCDQVHLNKLLFPRPKESPYESGFRGEDVSKCRRKTDGQQSDWYTIS